MDPHLTVDQARRKIFEHMCDQYKQDHPAVEWRGLADVLDMPDSVCAAALRGLAADGILLARADGDVIRLGPGGLSRCESGKRDLV